MSFTANSTGGNYTKKLYAKIGAVDNDVYSIGYLSAAAVSQDYDMRVNGASVGSIENKVNHSTPVVDGDNADLSMLPPYIAVYFWKRTA